MRADPATFVSSTATLNSGAASYKVLIADGIPAFRYYLREALLRAIGETQLKIIEDDGVAGCVNIACSPFLDMAIIDFALEGNRGLQAALRIWQTNPGCKILFSCERYRETYLRHLRKVQPPGAVYGIILKTGTLDELQRAVITVMIHNQFYVDVSIKSSRLSGRSPRDQLTAAEQDVLEDLCLGLTDRAVALKRKITLRCVQNRVLNLQMKLLKGEPALLSSQAGIDIMNTRARTMFEAHRRGLVDDSSLDQMDAELRNWILQLAPS